MKIGILGSRGIPNQYGGFEEFAEHLALGLKEMEASVWVYCSAHHPYKSSTWNGINLIHCLDAEEWIGTAGQFIYDFHCIRDSRTRNFDIIYQLGYTSSSVWFRLLPDGPAIVTNMDGLEWKRSKYNRLVRRFLKYAEKLAVHTSDTLIADSKAIQKYLLDEYQAVSEFVPYGATIFESPDVQMIRNENLEPGNYHMLIARMQQDNHIEEIIKGLLNSGGELPLLVVGNTQNKMGTYLRKRYECGHIRFPGAIFNRKLLNNLRHFCSVYFHGHSAGGTNPSLLEAMAAGALICAHNNPFNREVLGKNAFYFSRPEDIAELLLSGKINPAIRQKFIFSNLKTIKSRYNWEKIIKTYHRLFREMI